MASSTIFKNFNQPIENKSLLLITKDIAEGKYKDLIDPIRMALRMGKPDRVDKFKRELPAFTPSGTFEGGRKMEYLKMYSGFIHLDFDKLTPDELAKAKSQVCEMPTTFACFTSPSGNGFKVFIEVDTTAEHHSIAYKQVQEHYEKVLGIEADPKCKDITRLCFVSYDTETYRNIQNEKFKVQLPPDTLLVDASPPTKPKPPQQDENNPFIEIQFDDCVAFTENKISYLEGSRNNFIYALACNCNRKGIPYDDALMMIRNRYDLKEFEINASVKSAYNHNATQFGSYKTVMPKKENSTENDTDYLKSTPTYNDEIFDVLPEILRQGAEAFTDIRERDVFLTGALAILSGCLPNVSGEYSRETVYPNLFAFVIAPAASGKGALKFAKKLGDKHQDFLIETNKAAQQQYDAEMADFKAIQRDRKKGETVDTEEPEKPPFKVAFIPANSSYAKILQHIQQNEGTGIICETEADSMGNVLKHEWGGYSDMLRKAFHHETISLSRKTNDEYISIKEPKISIALSGTPGQVSNLISSAEDGLFSRFIFYAFKVEQLWRDVSPYGNTINLNEHFNALSEHTFQMIQFFEQSPTLIILSPDQWQALNNVGQKWLTEITLFTSDEAGSVAKRLGIILYRLAMIFTALRKFENGEATKEVMCTDEDFEIALNIANTFIEHSKLMFNNLPKQETQLPFKGANKQEFFQALPTEFKREEAITIAQKYSIKPRTADNLLKKLVEQGFLTQPDYGIYMKSS